MAATAKQPCLRVLRHPQGFPVMLVVSFQLHIFKRADYFFFFVNANKLIYSTSIFLLSTRTVSAWPLLLSPPKTLYRNEQNLSAEHKGLNFITFRGLQLN